MKHKEREVVMIEEEDYVVVYTADEKTTDVIRMVRTTSPKEAVEVVLKRYPEGWVNCEYSYEELIEWRREVTDRETNGIDNFDITRGDGAFGWLGNIEGCAEFFNENAGSVVAIPYRGLIKAIQNLRLLQPLKQ